MAQLPFPIQAGLVLALSVCLPSCVLKKPQTVNAAPPPPAPAVAAPAPPPQPLSIPQTEVHLPPPQPVSPEAAATAQPPEESTGNPQLSNRPGRPRPSTGTTSTRSPETPAPVVGPVGPAAPPPEHPLIQEVTPAAEQKRLQDEAAARKREVRQLIDPIDRRRLGRQQRGLFDRIQSFLKQSDDAERRGEMRQASELAQRALVLARELKP